METSTKIITVQTRVKASPNHVWDIWTQPEHIVHWNAASEDWHTPRAENDLRVGGKFNYRMEAKDKSFGFDFTGTYEQVIPLKSINYKMDDNRKVSILFEQEEDHTWVRESFEAENENEAEMQRAGWQAILDNFKAYAESKK